MQTSFEKSCLKFAREARHSVEVMLRHQAFVRSLGGDADPDRSRYRSTHRITQKGAFSRLVALLS
jgi:hypothetical protein